MCHMLGKEHHVSCTEKIVQYPFIHEVIEDSLISLLKIDMNQELANYLQSVAPTHLISIASSIGSHLGP